MVRDLHISISQKLISSAIALRSRKKEKLYQRYALSVLPKTHPQAPSNKQEKMAPLRKVLSSTLKQVFPSAKFIKTLMNEAGTNGFRPILL